MNKWNSAPSSARPKSLGGLAALLLGLAASWLGSNGGFGEEPPLSKFQIEAVFLFNFAKYVDWPATAFADATAPITIGVMGTDPIGDNLQRAIEGKSINGRPFVIKHLASDSDLNGCQILFISHSEAARVGGILDKARIRPILTVGEDEPFARNGGIIEFVLKSGNVRLEIDLAAARKAGLTISSRLLAVADLVKGKSS